MSGNKSTTQVNAHGQVTRKAFLKQSSLSLLGLGLLPFDVSSLYAGNSQAGRAEKENGGSDEKRVRSITYNIFNGCIGYKGINGRELPPGENSDLVKAARDMGQIPQRIMLELALYKPNIINFSEGPGEEVVAKMAKMLDLNYAYFPGGFPGAVLTTYEIISAENRPFQNKDRNDPKELFTRHWGKAKLRLPDGKVITVHSAHLWPFTKEENDTRLRLAEIKEIIASVKYDLANGSDSVLLQGDLNHTPGTQEYKNLNNAGLVDTFNVKGTGNGYTCDSIKPRERIDYIYAMGTLSKQIKSHMPLFEGNFRVNNEDPKGFALSDHIPVLADFAL
ncbi:MAG: endonuclease/exonuclease/phosphatase family protein [Chitinophagaceae bacterium]|nr:endonuclease/exonuclease/phosphatase family protein [Chitinophagaceae bacterium]